MPLSRRDALKVGLSSLIGKKLNIQEPIINIREMGIPAYSKQWETLIRIIVTTTDGEKRRTKELQTMWFSEIETLEQAKRHYLTEFYKRYKTSDHYLNIFWFTDTYNASIVTDYPLVRSDYIELPVEQEYDYWW